MVYALELAWLSSGMQIWILILTSFSKEIKALPSGDESGVQAVGKFIQICNQ